MSQSALQQQPARKGWLIAIFLLCVGAGLGNLITRLLDPTPAVQLFGSDEAQLVPGPWGKLQITRITIERPDEFISVNRTISGTNRWFFENYTANQLRDFFKQDDLTAPQQTILLDPSRSETRTNGIYVTPGTELILGLTPGARHRIYTSLLPFHLNHYQQYPFSIPANAVNDWFDKSGLSPDTEKLIRGLLYRNGDAMCFADMVEALSRVSSQDEKRRLVKAISRKRTLLVKLRVDEGENVEPLIKYWGKFGQAKDIQPLLESLARKRGGATLDIVHLLPPFARSRMYTYPFPSDDPVEYGHHCWWTSMNFFNSEPEERFAYFDEVKRTLQADYFPVHGDATFGDVVWFVDSNGIPIHSAVYVAEDFFFTKNGPIHNEPWCLMKSDDLLAAYATHSPLRLVAYRLKRG